MLLCDWLRYLLTKTSKKVEEGEKIVASLNYMGFLRIQTIRMGLDYIVIKISIFALIMHNFFWN